VWNYEDVLATLHRHPGVVVASIAGHTHQNGYLVDQAGIHHMVLPGVVEAPPGRDCYGIVDVFGDKLVLNGVDICMSCTCKLSEAAVARQERAAGRQQQQSVRSAAAAAAAAVAAGKSEVESDLVVDVASSADGSSAAASKLADDAGISLKALRLV
jgi:manganese-dependent ADP-ribose/CDP-alcohol diphosphatase